MRKTEPVWLNPFNGGYIIMPRDLWNQISSYSQESDAEPEAGGIFIGRYRGPHLEIVNVSEPLDADVRTRTSFHRLDPGHHDLAMRAWRRSGQTDTFVGEWHSHPISVPVPSLVDTQSWHWLTNATGLNMFFLVLGFAGHWSGVTRPSRHRKRLKRAMQLFGR